MKTCFKCKMAKERSEFYRHSAMADGLLGKCKQCAKADSRANYIANHDQYQAYEKRRNQDPKRRENFLRYLRHMRETKPDRYRARLIVNNHLRDGKLAKEPCEVCGSSRTEAHHDDYSQPLKVRWLCHTHHRMEHGTLVVQPKQELAQ